MSSFFAKKLDILYIQGVTRKRMADHSKTRKKTSEHASVAEIIRRRLNEGEGYFRPQDFAPLPASAISQALSRFVRQGLLQRISKGIYYRPRQTAFGQSRPSPSAIRQLPVSRKAVFPSGVSAANLLGFTTQHSSHGEFATAATSFPRGVVGKEVRLHTRRPEAWNGLGEVDAALLDFLRRRGATSELSEEETVQHLLRYFSEEGRFDRIVEIALSEPPRVRAMIGAIGQELKKDKERLKILKESLNPLTRFDFGVLSHLRYASEWQVKEQRTAKRERA
jgi:hypothetical protein